MQGLYAIGDFSKITGVPIDTLRYYHKIGLLIPEYTDPFSLYRYYSYPQLVKLDIIKVCRELGISLNQTAELFQKGDPGTFEKRLNEQREVLHKKIEMLKKSEQILGKLVDRLHISREVENRIGFYVSKIRERRISVSLQSIDFSKDELSNAKVFIELTEQLRNNHISNNYEGGYVYQIKKSQIAATYMFETVRNETQAADLCLKTVPGGQFLCINYVLPERDYILKKYFAEIEKRELNPGFILDSYLINGTFDSANRRFELQCPLT